MPWGNSKLLVKKCQNLSLGQTFLAAQFFSIHEYFCETTTTDIDKLLQVLLQFYNNNGRFFLCVLGTRIKNQVPRISENCHWVPRIRANRFPSIREIGSLQTHTGYLTFSLKKP